MLPCKHKTQTNTHQRHQSHRQTYTRTQENIQTYNLWANPTEQKTPLLRHKPDYVEITQGREGVFNNTDHGQWPSKLHRGVFFLTNHGHQITQGCFFTYIDHGHQNYTRVFFQCSPWPSKLHRGVLLIQTMARLLPSVENVLGPIGRSFSLS